MNYLHCNFSLISPLRADISEQPSNEAAGGDDNGCERGQLCSSVRRAALSQRWAVSAHGERLLLQLQTGL